MSEENYTTPPGRDERIVDPNDMTDDLADALEEKGMHLRKWNGFKFLGGGSGNNLGTGHFDTLKKMQRNEESIICIVTANPGKGKTYFALRMAELFDPNFDVTLQVCFTREDILHLIGGSSPLKRGQVIIIDEAHFGLGARTWFETVQKALINSLAAIRSKGLFIIIVCLHLSMMDKIIRKYVLSFMYHLEKRGLATAYQLYTPRFESEMRKTRLGQIMLKLPGIEGCTAPTCLSCQYSGVIESKWKQRAKWEEQGFKPCMSIRSVYERNKKEFVDGETAKAEAKQKQESLRENTPSNDELMPLIMLQKDELYFNKQGNIDRSSIQDIVSNLGYSVGHSIAGELGKRMMRKYRDELTQLREDKKNAQTT